MSVTPRKRPAAENAASGATEARARRDPLVILRPIPGTDKFDVMVVSNSFRGKPPQDRRRRVAAQIVIASHAGTLHNIASSNIYTTIGLTFDEAISLGYLPFKVDALLRGEEESLRDRIKQAVEAEGPIDTAKGPQLRYESFEAAQDAYRRLQERVPGPHWVIVQETSSD